MSKQPFFSIIPPLLLAGLAGVAACSGATAATKAPTHPVAPANQAQTNQTTAETAKPAAEPEFRQHPPAPTGTITFQLPQVQTAKLANGMKLVLIERHTLPFVGYGLILTTGPAVITAGKEGVANLTGSLLGEGTRGKTALQFADEVALLGAHFYSGSAADAAYVGITALKSQQKPALLLLADAVLHPAFRPADFKRVKNQVLANLVAQTDEPGQVAYLVARRL